MTQQLEWEGKVDSPAMWSHLDPSEPLPDGQNKGILEWVTAKGV